MSEESSDEGELLYREGNALREKGEHSKAVLVLLQSLNVFNARLEKERAVDVLCDLSLYYCALDMPEKAEKAAMNADKLVVLTKGEKSEHRLFPLQCLCEVYEKSGATEKLRETAAKLGRLSAQANDDHVMLSRFFCSARAAFSEGNYRDALFFLDQVVEAAAEDMSPEDCRLKIDCHFKLKVIVFVCCERGSACLMAGAAGVRCGSPVGF